MNHKTVTTPGSPRYDDAAELEQLEAMLAERVCHCGHTRSQHGVPNHMAPEDGCYTKLPEVSARLTGIRYCQCTGFLHETEVNPDELATTAMVLARHLVATRQLVPLGDGTWCTGRLSSPIHLTDPKVAVLLTCLQS